MNYLKYAPALILQHHLTELTWFVTNKCNLYCKHCFVPDRHRTSNSNLIGVDEVAKIGKYLPSLQRVCLSGGEPFIRNDISDIVTAIAQNWDFGILNLPTNGFFQEAIVKTIQHYGKTTKKQLRILFSLNALRNSMDTFTGVPGSFEQWERSFKRARAEATAYPNISIGVLTSFNDFNQDSFEMLMDYVLNNLNVKDFSFSLVRGHVTYRPHINLEKFNRLMIEYYAGKPGIGVLNTCHILFRESLVTYKKSNRFMVPCVSGKMRVVLSPDGDVYPCEALGYPCGFHAEQWCMGNIRSAGYNIPALLKTDLAGNIQNRIRTSSCHCDEACERSLSLLCSKKFQLRVFGRLVRNAASRMFHRQKTPARISPIT